MPRTLTRSPLAALLLMACSAAFAQQASEMTLADVLEVTLAHHGDGQSRQANAALGTGFLGGLPVLSALHVQSDLDRGTDETEVTLNLPVKSSLRRQLDDSLSGLEKRLDRANRAYRAWYFSGLIREGVWAHRLAAEQIEQAQARIRLLAQMESRAKLQVQAGNLPEYALLLTGQERLDAELLLADREAAQREAAQRFRALTSLPAVPSTIIETAPVPELPDYAVHPELVRIELDREQKRALAGLAGPQSANWNLALVARDFAGPGEGERQFGLAVDVPLGLVDVRNRGAESQKAAALRDHARQRDERLLVIRREWLTLQSDAQRLKSRQALLRQAAEMGDRIEAQLLSLRASNEVEAELVLRRLLDILDRRGELALIEWEIHRNAARQRQAAGQPL